MLQSIREHAQGWLAWVVVGAIAVVFVLWGVNGYVGSHTSNTAPVASVDGEDISRQELKQVYERALRMQAVPQNTDETAFKEQTLQTMITSKALTQAALKSGYRVSDALIDAELRDVPAFQVNGKFSPERFQQVLSQFYYNPIEYRSTVRNDVLVNQMRLGFMSSDFALPNEVQTVMRLLNQKRNIRYAVLPASQFQNNVTLPADAVKNYYEKNKARFVSPDLVSVDYIQLSLNELAKNVTVTPDEIKKYYHDNINQYTSPERRNVAHILIAVSENASPDVLSKAQATVDSLVKRIKQGESLGALAEKYSADPVSAKNKGVLPPFAKEEMVKPFADAAFAINKVGEIVGPIKTSFGYHIIELQGIQKAHVEPLEKVTDSIKTTLQQQRAEALFTKNGDRLQALTYENSDTLAPAATELHLPIQHTGLFPRKGGTDLATNPKFIKAAFSDEVVTQKYNSEVIEIDPKTVVVIRLREHVPAKQKTIAEVQDEITTQLRHEAAALKTAEVGALTVQALKQKSASDTKLNWQTVPVLSREDAQLPAELVKMAFSLPKPAGTPSVGGVALANGDYAVVQVNSVTEPALPPAQAKVEQQRFTPLLANAWGQLSYQLFVDSVLAKAQIHKWLTPARAVETEEDNS